MSATNNPYYQTFPHCGGIQSQCAVSLIYYNTQGQPLSELLAFPIHPSMKPSAETDSPEVGEEKQRRLLGQPEKISERLPCLPQAGGPGAFRTSVLARACVEAARFGGVPANRHVAPTPTAGFRSINE
jgi:hypothetical protein